jgi:hypothetical protein
MAPALFICACVVLPMYASAKGPRSASVKREFQLRHLCPATGRTAGLAQGYVKDHTVPLACGRLYAVSNLQQQTSTTGQQRINGKRGRSVGVNYRRAVTTMLTSRLLHREQTSRPRQSRTVVSEERTPSDRVC